MEKIKIGDRVNVYNIIKHPWQTEDYLHNAYVINITERLNRFDPAIKHVICHIGYDKNTKASHMGFSKCSGHLNPEYYIIEKIN